MKEKILTKILDYYNFSEEEFYDLIKDKEIIDTKAKCVEDFVYFLSINKNLKILIVGDYDADGITSTSILVRLLKELNFIVKFYIPSRCDEGYGLSKEILVKAKNNFDLVIAVDNGVKSYEAIEYAKHHDIKLAIIDHHEYEIEPEVDFFIHQNLLEEEFKYLSAAGLSYFIARKFRHDNYDLVLASIGLIADMMKVFKQTRAIIKHAHKYLLNNTPLQIKNLLTKTYHQDAIAFEIAPKINAVSRMGLGNVNELVNYFCSQDNEFINEYALKINEINIYRKHLTDQYCDYISRNKVSDNFIELIYHPEFKEGLCGLLANKISKQYKKPVLVVTKTEDLFKGSGRSYGDFDIYTYFNHQGFMEKFGGHKKAIGFSLKKNSLKELQDYIKNNIVDINVQKEETLVIDKEDLDEDLLELVDKLYPYGEGLKPIFFEIREPEIRSFFLIKNKYPKWITDFNFEAICFENLSVVKNPRSLIGTLSWQSKSKKVINMIVKSYY